MSVDLTLLERKAEQLHARYTMRFAGHARVTRDLAELDALIEETGAFLEELDSAGSAELKGQLNERLHMYHSEREAIREAQAIGPEVMEASALGLRANFIIFRYRRHFAGKPRATRDLGLLAECVEGLKGIQTRMTALAEVHPGQALRDDLEVVGKSLRTYVRERGEIVAARGMGLIDQKAEVLAGLANDQFKLYRLHFANKSRLSRRPALLLRMINNLEHYRDRMQSHRDAGLKSTSNIQNIKTVTDHLAMYKKELREIEKAQREAGIPERVDALANAANAVMADYRENFAGKNRASCDPALLSDLCDLLGEVELLMAGLDVEHDHATNRRNLSIVRDMLALYEREQREVEAARR